MKFFPLEELPTWWNGIHSRLKICPSMGMGSNPIVGILSYAIGLGIV